MLRLFSNWCGLWFRSLEAVHGGESIREENQGLSLPSLQAKPRRCGPITHKKDPRMDAESIDEHHDWRRRGGEEMCVD